MNIHVLGGIGTRKSSNQTAAGTRLRPHGHRNSICFIFQNSVPTLEILHLN